MDWFLYDRDLRHEILNYVSPTRNSLSDNSLFKDLLKNLVTGKMSEKQLSK